MGHGPVDAKVGLRVVGIVETGLGRSRGRFIWLWRGCSVLSGWVDSGHRSMHDHPIPNERRLGRSRSVS